MRLFVGSLLVATGLVGLPFSISRGTPPAPPAESEKFRQTALNNPALQPGEKLAQYTKYNFGPVWTLTPSTVVVGFVGADYQRLQVKVISAAKSTADPAVYQITGKTRVSGTVRAFTGTLRLQQVRLAKPVQYRPGEEGPAPDVATAGLAVGSYEFKESQALTRTGTFRGVVATHWYLDSKDRLHYDDIDKMSDGFRNNQFVGSWTSYSTQKALRCNWGDYRIPNSGDLDVGAGEFSPAEKYQGKGWQSYVAATNPANTTARQQEDQKWWK